MTPEMVTHIGRQALVTGLMIAAPVLLTSLCVGLLVAVLQAITSVREMTLSIIPKILAMGLALTISISWMIEVAISFCMQMFAQMTSVGV